MRSSQLSVIITQIVKPECRDLILQNLEAKASLVRQQKGCVQLLILEDADDPCKIVALQTWESPECWRAHLQTQEARELTELVKTSTTGFSFEKMFLHNI